MPNTEVDLHLVTQAQLRATGANVHKIQGLLRMYQSAAQDSSPQSQNACRYFEQALKEYLQKALP